MLVLDTMLLSEVFLITITSIVAIVGANTALINSGDAISYTKILSTTLFGVFMGLMSYATVNILMSILSLKPKEWTTEWLSYHILSAGLFGYFRENALKETWVVIRKVLLKILNVKDEN